MQVLTERESATGVDTLRERSEGEPSGVPGADSMLGVALERGGWEREK